MFKKIIDKKIINLAADTTNYGLNNKLDYYGSLKNKKCGDRIKIGLNIKNNKITKMLYEAEACVFCQASASSLSKKIKNIKIKKLNKIIFSQKFNILLSKKYLSRIDCILLPHNAVKKILKFINSKPTHRKQV